MVTDVSELKRTEARLRSTVDSLEAEAEAQRRRNAEETLAESQESLASTLAAIDAGFIASDRQGRVVRMNAVSEQLTGWSADEDKMRAEGCDGYIAKPIDIEQFAAQVAQIMQSSAGVQPGDGVNG